MKSARNLINMTAELDGSPASTIEKAGVSREEPLTLHTRIAFETRSTTLGWPLRSA